MHVSMMYVSIMRLKFCYGPTNERTNKAILGVGLYQTYFSNIGIYDIVAHMVASAQFWAVLSLSGSVVFVFVCVSSQNDTVAHMLASARSWAVLSLPVSL